MTTSHVITPRVIFACRKNGGRSVISRVLTERYAGDRVVATSARTEPGEQIHPEVARALADFGLDTSREAPKPLTRDMIATSDIAITIGCGEECPPFPAPDTSTGPSTTRRARTTRPYVGSSASSTSECALLAKLVPDLQLPPSVVAAAE